MIGSGREEAGNVGGPVVFVPSSALLIFDIRRAPPRGKLCEFVPRRGAGALEDFITGILLQLSGRYGDGRPRVLAKSTLRPLRVYGRGAEIKKDEREGEPSLSRSFVSRLLKKRRAPARSAGDDCKVDTARLQNRSPPVFRQQPVLLTTAFVHFVLLIASGIFLNVYPSA